MTIRFVTGWNGYHADQIVAGLSNEAALIADGLAVADLDGPSTVVVSGAWMKCPSIFRLRLTGTGSVQFDSRDSAGVVTAVATYALSGATDQIEFPFAGNNAVAIRATFSGGITVEVL